MLPYSEYGLNVRQVKTLNVSLTPEFHTFIANHVASGRFCSASEVVRAALRAFEREEAAQTIPSLTKPQAASNEPS